MNFINRENLRDAAIAVAIGLGLLLLFRLSARAQTAASMGLISEGVGIGAALLNEQQSLNMQRQNMAMQRQNMELQREMMERQQAALQAAQTPSWQSCPVGWKHQVIIHANGEESPGPCEKVQVKH